MDKLKIVIAENDEDEQDFLREGFQSTEYFEISAMVSNAAELFRTLEGLRTDLPDLILTDLNMEGQNGYDVLRYIGTSEVLSRVPVIVYSGSLLDSVVIKCLELGAKEVVMKPSSLDGYQRFPGQLFRLMTENG
jgi:CheY-like chemotaxis protein